MFNKLTGNFRELDEGYEIDVLLLDYEKAFDTVSHRKLMIKLQEWDQG
jgi:hypothetical protein